MKLIYQGFAKPHLIPNGGELVGDTGVWRNVTEKITLSVAVVWNVGVAEARK